MDAKPQQRSTGVAPKTASVDPLNITLGIEFEFMILESYEKGKRLGLEGDALRAYGLSLASEALKNPVQFTCSSCGEAQTSTLPLRVQAGASSKLDHKYWNVVTDQSIKLKNHQNKDLRENDCDVFGVELTSRVLAINRDNETVKSMTDAEHVHTVTYQEEITRVLNTMNKAFTSQTSTNGSRQARRLDINESCAFHVHIGNGTAGFPEQTIKNLLSICTAFERVIDGMHATSRIGGSTLAMTSLDAFSSEDSNDMASKEPMFRGIYNKALTERLLSSAFVTRRNEHHTTKLGTKRDAYPAVHMESNATLKQDAHGYHTAAFVEVIQQAPDVKSLQQLLTLYSENNVNILHLVVKPGENVNKERAYPRLNTIEFRQHAAITDPRDALPWIDFLQTLVKYAHSQSAEDVRATCARAASDPRFNLADLFDLLGVEQETQNFYLSRSNQTVQTAIDAARTQAELSGPNDPLRSTILELINERAEIHNPSNISRTIKTKSEGGGYGQFSREFIDVYAPELSEESKAKLTTGYGAPVWPEVPDDIPELQD